MGRGTRQWRAPCSQPAESSGRNEEIHAISSLATAKREYSTAFLINGTRGRGIITLRVSELEYWIATSDPDRDEPLRRAALREADGDPWWALRLLADPDWHAARAADGDHRGHPAA
jgi:hypothetical protein